MCFCFLHIGRQLQHVVITTFLSEASKYHQLFKRLSVSIIKHVRSTDRQTIDLGVLRKELEAYCSISDETWRKLSQICVLINLKKKQFLIKAGQIPQSFGFVYTGLLRAYITNQNGNEYNKIFFSENTFPGTIVVEVYEHHHTHITRW